MATSSSRPGMSPLWTKSWSLKLTLGGGGATAGMGWKLALPALDWRPEFGLNPSVQF